MLGVRAGARIGLAAGLAIGLGADELGGGLAEPSTELTVALVDSADPVASSGALDFTCTVENTGAVDADNLILTITLDESFTYVESSGTGWTLSRVGQIVTATRATLAPGAAPDVVVSVIAHPIAGHVATTSASCACANAPTANDSEQTTLTFSELPGRIFVVSEDGVPRWASPFPAPWSGHYYEFENGGAGPTAQGLNAWITAPLVGSGATRVALTSGERSWFNNACSINTGTVNNGYLTLTRDAATFASATSGTWAYEITFSLETLSTAGEAFSVLAGFSDSQSGLLFSEGAILRYQHSVNGGRAEFVTAHSSSRTAADSGVTITAGHYYRFRVELINDTSARFWLKTIYDGATYADDGVWSDGDATEITTNLPTGPTADFIGMCSILKSAGTTPRSLKIGYQLMYRVPPYTGEPGNDPGTALAIDANGEEAWVTPMRPQWPIIFQAWGHGGWVPSIASTAAPPFGQSFGGSGSNGSITGTTLDNGYLGSSNLNTGPAADGHVCTHTSKTLYIDDDLGTMVLEMTFEVPTLSAVAQQFKFTFGLLDSPTADCTNGVFIELDSFVAAAFQCKTREGGTTTTTSSGLNAVAGTRYIARIVITPANVDFYIKAENAAAYGTPVASIATNIPDGVAMHAAARNVKLAGTTSRLVRYQSISAFQRVAA